MVDTIVNGNCSLLILIYFTQVAFLTTSASAKSAS